MASKNWFGLNKTQERKKVFNENLVLYNFSWQHENQGLFFSAGMVRVFFERFHTVFCHFLSDLDQ